MSAAPIENDNIQNYNNDSVINKKRQAHPSHNKTQKQRPSNNDFDHQKVNSVLQSIHNAAPEDDADLGNYNPKGSAVAAKHSEDFKPLNPYEFPAQPVSMGSERTKKPEGMTNMDYNIAPQPTDNSELDLQELQSNFMNDAQVRDYYKKLVPNYNHTTNSEHNKKYYANQSAYSSPNLINNDTNQVLIEKLNYMINLLEEQQDQKTGNVTEEVVLYSFLGVFIIFIVDSFVRVGKYVR
jgi:hypothetical protein